MARNLARTLEQQTGQLLIMGFEGTELTARLRSMLTALQPGGIVLFARNIHEPRQTWQLLHECQKCVRTPLFLCVDMEGGTVDRLKNVIAPAPSAATVFASGNRQLFRLHGRVIGEEVRAIGFNVDFAPVCDLALSEARTVLTSRTVSPQPNEVVTYACEFLRGLREVRVLSAGKHFPGLGGGAFDTHHKAAVINRTMKQLWNEDLLPYRELHRRMPFVMVSHAAYPAVTKDNTPASFSRKWITNILREKIGYKGLVISDDLEMGAAVIGTAEGSGDASDTATLVGHAALQTVKAGSDIYLVCHNADAVMAGYHAVLDAARRDKRVAARVAESARRVMALKRRAALEKHRCPLPTQKVIDRLRRDLWEFEEEVRLVTAAR